MRIRAEPDPHSQITKGEFKKKLNSRETVPLRRELEEREGELTCWPVCEISVRGLIVLFLLPE